MSVLARVNHRSLAACAALAVTTIALTASGQNSAGNAESWVELGTVIDSGGDGKVTLVDDFTTLNTAANTVYDGPLGARDSSVRTGAGDKTTAEVRVKANYSRGTWDVSGSWRDGLVKFTFGGNAAGTEDAKFLQDVMTVCQEITSEDCPLDQILNPGRSVRPSDRGSSAGWLKGGCVSVISYYRSTNRSYPGTGIVEVLLCDAGTGSDVAGGGWAGQDLIQVSVPASGLLQGSEESSPYRAYVGGGTLKTSALSVRTKYDGSEPTSTPTPPWLAP